jgi:hypothetical protein
MRCVHVPESRPFDVSVVAGVGWPFRFSPIRRETVRLLPLGGKLKRLTTKCECYGGGARTRCSVSTIGIIDLAPAGCWRMVMMKWQAM